MKSICAHFRFTILGGALALFIVAAMPQISAAQTIFWSKSGTSIPYSSTWSGSAWGAAMALPTLAAPGYWLQAASPPNGSETALVATNSAGAGTVMFNSTGSFGTPTTFQANVGTTVARRFAVAYEQSSGHLMLVYSNGTDHSYRTATSGALSAAATAYSAGASTGISRLCSKNGSDTILMLASDASNSGTLRAREWDGSAWGATATLLTPSLGSITNENFAGVYERTSGTALVVYSNSTTSPQFRTYSGGVWSGAASMTACSGTPNFIHLAAKPGSDEIACGILDSAKHLRMYIWNGSSWASSVEVSTDTEYSDRRPFDVAYQPDGSKALVAYSDGTTTPVYRTYNGATWSAATGMTDMGPPGPHNKPAFAQVVPGKSGGEMFVVVTDSFRLKLCAWRWNGSAMGTMTTIESSIGGSNTTEQFWMLGSSTAKKKVATWREVPYPDPSGP